MKIVDENHSTQFEMVLPGDVFTKQGVTCIKMTKAGTAEYNAVNLLTGVQVMFKSDDWVDHRKGAELTL